jgi:hypothetical protein
MPIVAAAVRNYPTNSAFNKQEAGFPYLILLTAISASVKSVSAHQAKNFFHLSAPVFD